MLRLLYTVLFYLAVPLIALNLLRRARKAPAYAQRWGERFGFAPRIQPDAPGAIWVHAVSVGEFQAALPLIKRLLTDSTRPVIVTTTTPTGSARVQAELGDQVLHSYLPYDLPDALARFMARTRPAALVVIECELWPNLFAACARRDIPITLVNARISPNSARGYARIQPLTRQTLSRVNHVLAQGADDAERFRALGAPAGRVGATGNLKYDLAAPAKLGHQRAELIDALGWHDTGEPVLVAGSVHPGEWNILLDAFKTLRARWPAARLVLVPRKPEKFAACAREAKAAGWQVSRRSAPSDAPDVLIGDSMGELGAYFSLGNVAFVGGSLVPIGGHNVLEPATQGLPVLFGPHRFVFPEAGEKLEIANAGWEVTQAQEITDRVDALWREPDVARDAGQAGLAVIEANRGALDRAVKAVLSSASG